MLLVAYFYKLNFISVFDEGLLFHYLVSRSMHRSKVYF